jgi:hypothetical protein
MASGRRRLRQNQKRNGKPQPFRFTSIDLSKGGGERTTPSEKGRFGSSALNPNANRIYLDKRCRILTSWHL